MDRMIYCHECKVEEMIDDYYSDEWKCPKCNQPERSKREDVPLIFYNARETMRSSELCGKIVRDK